MCGAAGGGFGKGKCLAAGATALGPGLARRSILEEVDLSTQSSKTDTPGSGDGVPSESETKKSGMKKTRVAGWNPAVG